MSPDLALHSDERLVSDAVAKFCAAAASAVAVHEGAGRFDRALWRSFCRQGFFALGTPEGEGGARLVVACAEPLGRAVFPGPVVDTFLAAQVLEPAERARLIEGDLVVSSGEPPILPFAAQADLHLGLSGGHVRRLTVQGAVTALDTLGGEPWGRASFVLGPLVPHAARGLFFADVALAAYLTAAARGLLERTAEHVATRKQFGRAVGSFQAVAHPLADCHIALSAAQALARAAAAAFDDADGRARPLATAALGSSRRAALETAYTCHQKLGAIGVTRAGPAHSVTRRIRQLAARVTERVGCEPSLVASFGG